MTILRRLPVLLCLGITVPALAQRSPEGTTATIAALDDSWTAAYNAGNAAKIASLYAVDAMLLPPGTDPLIGSDKIRDYFADRFSLSLTLALNHGEILEASDNVAIEWGGWIARDTTHYIVDQGYFVNVLQRDGARWRIYKSTWNSCLPGCTRQ